MLRSVLLGFLCGASFVAFAGESKPPKKLEEADRLQLVIYKLQTDLAECKEVKGSYEKQLMGRSIEEAQKHIATKYGTSVDKLHYDGTIDAPPDAGTPNKK